jgi:hypothetical protein
MKKLVLVSLLVLVAAGAFAAEKTATELQKLQSEAEQGKVIAMYLLGQAYNPMWKNSYADCNKSVYWYQKAATADGDGSLFAEEDIADMYYYGRCFPVDRERAVEKTKATIIEYPSHLTSLLDRIAFYYIGGMVMGSDPSEDDLITGCAYYASEYINHSRQILGVKTRGFWTMHCDSKLLKSEQRHKSIQLSEQLVKKYSNFR